MYLIYLRTVYYWYYFHFSTYKYSTTVINTINYYFKFRESEDERNIIKIKINLHK